jgi:hypothetical protein
MGNKIKFAIPVLVFSLLNPFSSIQGIEDKETKESSKELHEPNDKHSVKIKENQEPGKPANKQPKKIEGNILKNPDLINEFKESSFDDQPFDHAATYLFYGLLTGGIMGAGGGLSFYTTSSNLTPIFLSAGAVGAAGAISGFIIALIETSSHNPLIGSDFVKYTWYGVFGGALIGGLAGFIPYTNSNNDIAVLFNWIGYGSFAGLGAGIALFFLLPKSALKNLVINTSPEQSRVGYKFMF